MIAWALAACLLPAFACAGTPYDLNAELLVNLPEGKALEELFALAPGPALAADKKVAELLAANRVALDGFRETAKAASDGYFLWPKPADLAAQDAIPPLMGLTKLYRMALLDAAFWLSVNQPREAERDLLAVAGLLGQLAHQGSGRLVKQLYLQLAFQRAYPLLARSVADGRASAAYLGELAMHLAGIEKAQNNMESAFLDEEALIDYVFDKLKAEKLPFSTRAYIKFTGDTTFVANVTVSAKAALAEETKVYIEAVRLNSPEMIKEYREKVEQGIKERAAARGRRSWWAAIKDGTRGGEENRKKVLERATDLILSVDRPSYEKLIPRYQVFLSHLRVLRAGMALNRYRRDRGQPPASLAKLVPAYLPEVPADPYNNLQPLGYMKAGKTFRVYALGPDKKDDKGAVPFDWDAYFADPAKNTGDIIIQN
ncbi:MAG TPA: hypothetical protein DCZ92_14730 [Elusimicrobia bacterium]|nr:hypothetical protein [Elusimicrobiota bacterium]